MKVSNDNVVYNGYKGTLSHLSWNDPVMDSPNYLLEIKAMKKNSVKVDNVCNNVLCELCFAPCHFVADIATTAVQFMSPSQDELEKRRRSIEENARYELFIKKATFITKSEYSKVITCPYFKPRLIDRADSFFPLLSGDCSKERIYLPMTYSYHQFRSDASTQMLQASSFTMKRAEISVTVGSSPMSKKVMQTNLNLLSANINKLENKYGG